MKVVQVLILMLFILNIYLGYKVLFAPRGINNYLRLKHIKKELIKKIDLIQNENIRLSKQIELIQHNRKFKEKMIRKILHYGKDGEVLYIVSRNK